MFLFISTGLKATVNIIENVRNSISFTTESINSNGNVCANVNTARIQDIIDNDTTFKNAEVSPLIDYNNLINKLKVKVNSKRQKMCKHYKLKFKTENKNRT